jgi:hypothetical protein
MYMSALMRPLDRFSSSSFQSSMWRWTASLTVQLPSRVGTVCAATPDPIAAAAPNASATANFPSVRRAESPLTVVIASR